MIISEHKLRTRGGATVPFIPSPNIRHGRIRQRFLLLHYTASPSMDSAVRWLTEPLSGSSAHLVVGRSGDVVQLVPFDTIALHAGRSRWCGVEGLNRCSIGIELENAGRLERKGGRWQAWFGGDYADRDVMEAPHKHDGRLAGWHIYADEQIATVSELARLLVDVYDLEDVVGHDDVAPYRKQDPGPAFPMEAVRGRALGRAASTLEQYETISSLNIRAGAGLDKPLLPDAPLPRGTRLRMIASDSEWCLVEVVGDDGLPHATGWVHSAYIRRAA